MCTTLMRYVYRVLAAEAEGTFLPGKFGYRGDDNIKMHIKDIRRQVVDWDNLVQGKDQWRSVLNLKIKLLVVRSAGILDCLIRHSLDAIFSGLNI